MPSEPDQLDTILEKGIASYAGAEPLAGMEERILARIQVAKTQQSAMNRWWILTGLGFAGLLIAFTAIFFPRHSPPMPPTIPAKASSVETRRMQSPHTRILRPKRLVNVRALPKRKVFPTPRPVTAEEHLLMALVARDPEGTARVFEGLRRNADSPLEISPIAIAPLPTGEDQ